MTETGLSSGMFWVIIDVAGVVVLAIAAIYGIMMWRKRRQQRRPDTIGAQPGPAPKHLEGKDDRATVR